jgi:hypothetical protein
MNEMVTPPVAEDAAWASINTPLSVAELKAFCRDIERLYRINPMLEFQHFKVLGQHQYAYAGRNISQETPFEFDYTFTVKELPDGFQVDYDQGIKSGTLIKIEPASEGSKLTITDYYERLPAEERQQHLPEVDKSLLVWANYLQRYLVTWSRWSRFAVWRWYMRRIWQPMKPAARRITYSLLWISVVEIALIALGVAIYFVEFR